MGRNTQHLNRTLLFAIELFAAVSSLTVNAIPEERLNPNINHLSMEIMTLSRGRGVPDTTLLVFQEIVSVANTALEFGSVVSVSQQTVGLEGETRLCITFRDKQALGMIGDKIRILATNVDLLQVNDNRCSVN